MAVPMKNDPSRKRKRRGRPKGSANVRRTVIACHPGRCPNCGRTVKLNLNAKPNRVYDHTGRLPDGQTTYDRIEYRHTSCACGQGLVVWTAVTEGKTDGE